MNRAALNRRRHDRYFEGRILDDFDDEAYEDEDDFSEEATLLVVRTWGWKLRGTTAGGRGLDSRLFKMLSVSLLLFAIVCWGRMNCFGNAPNTSDVLPVRSSTRFSEALVAVQKDE